MRPALFSFLLLVAIAGTLVLSPGDLAAQGEEVVAEVAGKAVTHAELEDFLRPQLDELDRQRHRILEAGLAQLVDQRLLDAEAARRGLTTEELVSQEIEAHVGPVTDEEIETWYAANQAQVRRPLETVRDQVQAYLANQKSQEARKTLIDGLRGKHGAQVLLEPLRVAIDNQGAYTLGGEKGVELTVFADFQCPPCGRIKPVLGRLVEAYGDRLKLVYRDFPLHDLHPEAQKAAEAARCAGDQGKFWPMHDAMFANQRALGVEALKEQAATLGLDTGAFATCLDGDRHREAVLADVEAGRAVGVSGTPTMFVNGRPVQLLRGSEPFDQLSVLIDDELGR